MELSTSPIFLYQSDAPFFRGLSFGLESDYTVFKQNHKDESRYIRNTARTNVRPYLEASLGNIGAVQFRSNTSFDYQNYHFGHLERDRSFSKEAFIHQTEASFALTKVYGRAFMARVPIPDVQPSEENEDVPQSTGDLIGTLPSVEDQFARNEEIVSEDSYKHGQHIVVRHYFLGGEKTRGNERFLQQISESNGQGQFDHIDALRAREHLIRQQESLITLPKINTVELQWNHSLVKKSVKSLDAFENESANRRERFSYRESAFFNISQGIDLNQEGVDTSDKLTRLSVRAGINHSRFRLRGQEYYFYSQGEHIFNLSYSHDYDWGDLSFIHSHDSLSIPTRNFSTLGIGLNITDTHKIYTFRSYDFEQRHTVEEDYGILFTPANNCWMLDLKYEKDILEGRISVNFLINFNENNFRGFSGT